MTPRLFAALGGLAALSLVAAGAVYNMSSRWQPAESDRSMVFPGLVDEVNDVAALNIDSAGKEMVIERSGEHWLITSHGGYRADVAKVRANIVGVAELHRIEPKTADPDLYPRIEVEDATGEEANSRHFTMVDEDGETLASLIVGKRKVNADGPGRNGAYIRVDGEDRAWLAGGDVNISLDLADWVNTRLFDLEVPDVASLAVSRGDAYPIRLTRAEGENGGYTLSELPEGLEPASAYALQSIIRRTTQVRFDDVRTARDGGEPAAVAEIATADGMTLKVSIGEAADGRWVAISATGEGDAAASARAFNEVNGGFEFHIPARDAETMVVTLADVIASEGS